MAPRSGGGNPAAATERAGAGGVASSSRWPKAEELALIQLRCGLDMSRKGAFWEEISAGMRGMSYSRSSKQCRQKWWTMNNYFQKVNKMDPEDSNYFHQLEAFYRNQAATLGSPAGDGLGCVRKTMGRCHNLAGGIREEGDQHGELGHKQLG